MNSCAAVTLKFHVATRGKNLSGSLQGAGGIGGLLARSEISNFKSPHSYYHADGNGNITCLVNGNNAVVAKYIYDPYGNLISARGPLAEANLYRFSSKEWHVQSGLVYYLYRYYEPNAQRWINRDPIGKKGGINLYQFVGNSPTGRYDPSGLHWTGIPDSSLLPVDYWPRVCKCRNMVSDAMFGADKWANDNFGVPGQMHSKDGSVADMLTHCVGACEAAKGEGVCKGVGIDPRQYLQDREHGGTISPDYKLDFENNKVGFEIADSGKDCKSGCLEALREGRLWTRVGGDAGPYIPPPPKPTPQ